MEKLNAYIDKEQKNGYQVVIGFCPVGEPGRVDYEKGCVILDRNFYNGLVNDFSENNLIDVLYHEIGHLEYFKNNPILKHEFDEDWKANSELFAFTYSLNKLIDIAKNGDIAPLKASIIKINERIVKIMNNNFNDEEPSHVIALRYLSESKIYYDCCKFVEFSDKQI